ncbi:pancreatic secretory granule membrane major glycoprotein GP2 [Hoplias malabaricus]|uniref:pancreatic secretory granule membrane major glycoprotein GP2 n=1 Tax=Hoplias malabaricus TaxID=27720 RepID=UPI00346258A9
MDFPLKLCLAILLFMSGVAKAQNVTCDDLYCTEREECTVRSGYYGCSCSEDNPRSNSTTFDAIETCAGSSASLSLSRCQLFDAGFPSENLHLNDPNCQGSIQDGRLVFNFDNYNQTCGTTLTSNGTHFIYMNAVQTSVGQYSVISRESWLTINFSCVYPLVKDISMPMALQANPSVVSRDLSTEGTYEIRMIPFPNGSFIEPFSGNVTLDVNQEVFIAVVVDGVDEQQIALVLDRCWATPVYDINSTYSWNLIINGCPNPNDGTVRVLQNGLTTDSMFSFRMFTFTSQSDNIFLHCQVHLCLRQSGVCAQTCSNSNVQTATPRPSVIHDTAAITMSFQAFS